MVYDLITLLSKLLP